MKRHRPISPRPIPKKAEYNLLRGTTEDWSSGSEEPIEPARPFRGQTILDDLARERSAITGQTPLEFLLEVMRDTRNNLDTRILAARSAAPYVHPKLAQIVHKPADGAEGQIVFLGGVLASPAPMIEMHKMDS